MSRHIEATQNLHKSRHKAETMETRELDECSKVLKMLENDLIQILNCFIKMVETAPPPQTLYHYTNDSGLHGILESGKLRLSNIFSLNDPSEIGHGLSHAKAILSDETREATPQAKDFAEKFSRFCQDGINSSAYFYVCSFSTNENDLGQWRAYADNGRGYALEFEANPLAVSFASLDGEADAHRNNAFHMHYNDDEIKEIHRQLIARCVPLISLPSERLCNGMFTEEYLINLGAVLSEYALETALYFKHEAYEKESEFRFLEIFGRHEDPKVKWRVRSNELVDYRDFNWRGIQPQVLKRIIIGPAANRSKAERFVRACLAAYHPKEEGEVEISYCGIPYRAV